MLHVTQNTVFELLKCFPNANGALWVFRNCLLSFAWNRPGHVLRMLRFLSFMYSADFRRYRLAQGYLTNLKRVFRYFQHLKDFDVYVIRTTATLVWI